MSGGGEQWRWVESSVVFAIHDRQLAEHGGMDGIRDRAMVESALARPAHLAYYGNPDAADLAAAYAYGITKNHGFVDGNKRTAWSPRACSWPTTTGASNSTRSTPSAPWNASPPAASPRMNWPAGSDHT